MSFARAFAQMDAGYHLGENPLHGRHFMIVDIIADTFVDSNILIDVDILNAGTN
jgi:hypothetical protein